MLNWSNAESPTLRHSSTTVATPARSMIFDATACPRSGGTEFPTCRNPCHLVTWNRNQSGYECSRAASLTVMHLGEKGCIGRGEVNAPRSLAVPARMVLQTPSGSSLRKRLTGSVSPGSVASKRLFESGVWTVRRLEVEKDSGFSPPILRASHTGWAWRSRPLPSPVPVIPRNRRPRASSIAFSQTVGVVWVTEIEIGARQCVCLAGVSREALALPRAHKEQALAVLWNAEVEGVEDLVILLNLVALRLKFHDDFGENFLCSPTVQAAHVFGGSEYLG